MAVFSMPHLRSSGMAGKIRTAGKSVSAAAVKVLSPHKASLRRLQEMPLTVAGTACIDFAAFHYVHMIGWLVTGVSLVLVEHMIADDDQPGRRM